MAKVYISSVIDAPTSEVWAHIRDFGGLPTELIDDIDNNVFQAAFDKLKMELGRR